MKPEEAIKICDKVLEIMDVEQLGVAVDTLGKPAEWIFLRYLLARAMSYAALSNPDLLILIYRSAKEFQAFSEKGFE